MRFVVAPVVFCAFVVGCRALEGGEPDAGFEPCAPVDGVVDAGECPAESDGVDVDGGSDRPTDEDACADLLVKTCGAEGQCGDDPGCKAADLTSRFEPEKCFDALAANGTFPACTGGSCDRLVDKVCGVAPATTCATAPGCGPAQTLQQRADDGDASAQSSCGAALSDEGLFPPCGG